MVIPNSNVPAKITNDSDLHRIINLADGADGRPSPRRAHPAVLIALFSGTTIEPSPAESLARLRGAMLGCMKRPDLTEDAREEVTVLALRELLRQFGDPLKRPSIVILWPNSKRKALAEGIGNQPKGRAFPPGPSFRRLAHRFHPSQC